jgi:hypothetical protein
MYFLDTGFRRCDEPLFNAMPKTSEPLTAGH